MYGMDGFPNQRNVAGFHPAPGACAEAVDQCIVSQRVIEKNDAGRCALSLDLEKPFGIRIAQAVSGHQQDIGMMGGAQHAGIIDS